MYKIQTCFGEIQNLANVIELVRLGIIFVFRPTEVRLEKKKKNTHTHTYYVY